MHLPMRAAAPADDCTLELETPPFNSALSWCLNTASVPERQFLGVAQKASAWFLRADEFCDSVTRSRNRMGKQAEERWKGALWYGPITKSGWVDFLLELKCAHLLPQNAIGIKMRRQKSTPNTHRWLSNCGLLRTVMSISIFLEDDSGETKCIPPAG